MKKYMILASLVFLSACATTTEAGSGLVKLDTEPKDCEYLYTLDSSATNYKLTGAYEYLEKTILEQEKVGDSYYIVKQDISEIQDAIFGPDKTFKFKVKVYNCQK
jgi:hypothetical protein